MLPHVTGPSGKNPTAPTTNQESSQAFNQVSTIEQLREEHLPSENSDAQPMEIEATVEKGDSKKPNRVRTIGGATVILPGTSKLPLEDLYASPPFCDNKELQTPGKVMAYILLHNQLHGESHKFPSSQAILEVLPQFWESLSLEEQIDVHYFLLKIFKTTGSFSVVQNADCTRRQLELTYLMHQTLPYDAAITPDEVILYYLRISARPHIPVETRKEYEGYVWKYLKKCASQLTPQTSIKLLSFLTLDPREGSDLIFSKGRLFSRLVLNLKDVAPSLDLHSAFYMALSADVKHRCLSKEARDLLARHVLIHREILGADHRCLIASWLGQICMQQSFPNFPGAAEAFSQLIVESAVQADETLDAIGRLAFCEQLPQLSDEAQQVRKQLVVPHALTLLNNAANLAHGQLFKKRLGLFYEIMHSPSPQQPRNASIFWSHFFFWINRDTFDSISLPLEIETAKLKECLRMVHELGNFSACLPESISVYNQLANILCIPGYPFAADDAIFTLSQWMQDLFQRCNSQPLKHIQLKKLISGTTKLLSSRYSSFLFEESGNALAQFLATVYQTSEPRLSKWREGIFPSEKLCQYKLACCQMLRAIRKHLPALAPSITQSFLKTLYPEASSEDDQPQIAPAVLEILAPGEQDLVFSSKGASPEDFIHFLDTLAGKAFIEELHPDRIAEDLALFLEREEGSLDELLAAYIEEYATAAEQTPQQHFQFLYSLIFLAHQNMTFNLPVATEHLLAGLLEKGIRKALQQDWKRDIRAIAQCCEMVALLKAVSREPTSAKLCDLVEEDLQLSYESIAHLLQIAVELNVEPKAIEVLLPWLERSLASKRGLIDLMAVLVLMHDHKKLDMNSKIVKQFINEIFDYLFNLDNQEDFTEREKWAIFYHVRHLSETGFFAGMQDQLHEVREFFGLKELLQQADREFGLHAVNRLRPPPRLEGRKR